MKRQAGRVLAGLLLGLGGVPVVHPAGEKLATTVYARVGQGYQRVRLKDGSFKPEYYALSNGGRIAGTAGDSTVERVTYPEVAEIAMRLLAQQNYRYAQTKEQAKLLLVLQWGNTIAPNGTNYTMSVSAAATAYAGLFQAIGGQGMGRLEMAPRPVVDDVAQSAAAAEPIETAMLRLLMDNRIRDQVNEHNARVLGYMDDLAETNDIRRWAGGGDRYLDLIQDVEEARYYIVISAYDFPSLAKEEKKLLWQTRVSVRSPGNSFDDSVVPMLKTASRYFGQDSGKLVRGEESKGTVEMGDMKFLGEAKETKPNGSK